MIRALRLMCLTVCVALAGSARADEIVNAAPSQAELGRYTILRTSEMTARFDSATGSTWFLCTRKAKQAWCKGKEPALPSGPVGRYRLVDATPLLLIDTVTGRSWTRCEMPTPEKGLAWCAVDE